MRALSSPGLLHHQRLRHIFLIIRITTIWRRIPAREGVATFVNRGWVRCVSTATAPYSYCPGPKLVQVCG